MTVRTIHYDAAIERLHITGFRQTGRLLVHQSTGIAKGDLPPNVRQAIETLIEYARDIDQQE